MEKDLNQGLPIGPDGKATIPDDVVAAFTKTAEIVTTFAASAFDTITRVLQDAGKVALWARKNRPRLVHLALHAKTARRRKKNRERMIEEYYKEVGAYGKG